MTTNAAVPETGDVTAVPDQPRPSRLRRIATTPAVLTFGFLVVTMMLFALLAPGKFGTISNFGLLAQNVAILTVVSVGTTFVIATGGIDLSIPSGIVLGEVFAVRGLSMITVGSGTAVDIAGDQTNLGYILLAMVFSVGAGSIIGLINGVVVAYLRVPAMLATLGTLGGGLGIALLMQNGVNIATYALTPVSSGNYLFGLPNLILIALVVAVLGAFALSYSVFGRHTLAIGSSPEAARRVGIKVERHLVSVYLLGGLMSGFAGFLSLSYFTTTSVAGHSTDNLQAITAVALGGTSLFGGVATVFGTIVGVWIPAILQNGFVIVGVQPYWQMVAVGAVLILAVWFDRVRRSSQGRR